MDDIFDQSWEPWMDYDLDDWSGVGCEYCGSREVMDTPDPFGGKRCCASCRMQLIEGN